MKMTVAIALFLLLPAPAFAVEVLYTQTDPNFVVVRQPARPYRVGDTLCLDPVKERVRCGKVIKTSRKDATVFLNVRGEGVDILTSTPKPSKK
jgi:hypothetical protein